MSGRSPFKVLLVDDEEEFVRALAERLELRGFEPEVALSGELALQVIEERAPDVIVLDLRMPGMDGVEVLRRVKRTHPRIQVIILTGHGSEADARTVRSLGAFEHLQKPVEVADLVRCMQEAYERASREEGA